MATYIFNPTDYQIPTGLNFQVAREILRVVFEKLRTHLGGTPTYEQLRDEIIRVTGGSKKFEIKMNNVLGKQNPSSSTGGAATFLATYFPGEDLATRQSDFSNLPSGFITGVGDGVRLKFTTTGTHVIIAIVADNKSKGVADQDLYHLTMPRKPADFPDSRKHYTIHFTDESTGQHDYYRFNDLRTLVLSEGGGGGSSSTSTPSIGKWVSSRVQQAQAQGQSGQTMQGNTSTNPVNNYVLSTKKTVTGKPLYEMGGKYYTEVSGNFKEYNGPKRGGKRRSTRRRRALRKTRKAYI